MNIIKSQHSQQIWFCVDKNGFICMFTEKPIKNVVKGTWESKNPYINSKIYNDICAIVQQAKMTFENEPEVIEMQFQI